MTDVAESTINTGGDQTPATNADTSIAFDNSAAQDVAPTTEGWKANNISEQSLNALMAAKGITEDDLNADDEDIPVTEGDNDTQVPAADVDDESPEALNEGQDEGGKEPTTVPYNRLKEKVAEANAASERATALEAQLTEMRTAQANEQRIAQERAAIMERATPLGITSPEEYQQANEWAQSQGAASIEDYVALQNDAKELQALADSLKEDYRYDDETRAEKIETRRLVLEAQRESRQTRELQQFLTQQVVEREIEAARNEFGGSLAPELEQQFRHPSVSPKVVKDTVALFKKQAAPLLAVKDAEIAQHTAKIAELEAVIEEARTGLPAAIKEREQNAVAQAAAKRAQHTKTPSPEGAGGSPPRPASAPATNWKQNVMTPLGSLLARQAKRSG